MAIDYEQLQSTLGEQNRRWSYTSKQFESPYLKNRAAEVEKFKVKTHKANAQAAKSGGPAQASPSAPTRSGKPVRVEVVGDLEAARKTARPNVPVPEGAPDLSRFDQPHPNPTPSRFPQTPLRRMTSTASPFVSSSSSPTNFRDQKTAGAKTFAPKEKPRSPFARPGEVLAPKPTGSWAARTGNKLVGKAQEIGQRRAATSASSAEMSSAARGVTHSTGESWSARTGNKLISKANAIGARRSSNKSYTVGNDGSPFVSTRPSTPSSEGRLSRAGNKLVAKSQEIGQKRNGHGGRVF